LAIITPIISSNHALISFFCGTWYGIALGVSSESLGVILLLVFIKLFKVSLIPHPGKALASINFIDIFIFGGLSFVCYLLVLLIWESGKSIPMLFLIKPFIGFIVTLALLIAYSLKKSNDQKVNENKDQEFQELNKKYQALKNLYDPDIPDFGSKLDLHFTPREQDVLMALADGMSNQMMAKSFFLTNGTIANVISRLMIKLELESREQLVLFAIAWVNKYKPVKRPN
jgi:DNA-binding CsgD family transcriptional regulator